MEELSLEVEMNLFIILEELYQFVPKIKDLERNYRNQKYKASNLNTSQTDMFCS